MLQTESKAIGDHTYLVTQLGAGEGRKMFVRLTRALAPVFGALLEDAGSTKGGFKLGDMSLESLSRTLHELAQRLTEDDLEYVCRTFGAKTMVQVGEGKEIQLTLDKQELHFAGRYGHMFQWLAFCLEVNYRDFLGVTKGFVSAQSPAVKGMSQ